MAEHNGSKGQDIVKEKLLRLGKRVVALENIISADKERGSQPEIAKNTKRAP
jgi:hypothetical protein